MRTANVFREKLSANLVAQMAINKIPIPVNAIPGSAILLKITRALKTQIVKLCKAMFQTTISGANQTMSKTGTPAPV